MKGPIDVLLTENLKEKWNSTTLLIEFAKSPENPSIIIISAEKFARFLFRYPSGTKRVLIGIPKPVGDCKMIFQS